MFNHVYIIDYLAAQCPFKGCDHNEEGNCTYIDEDFSKLILRAKELGQEKIECDHIEYGYNACKYCGGNIETIVETHPYGDISEKQYSLICNSCERRFD